MHQLQQVNILGPEELSIQAGSFNTITQEPANLKVSLTPPSSLRNKSLIQLTNKRGNSGEDSGTGWMALEQPVTGTKFSGNFSCKTKSLIFEEVEEAPNFQRTLILHSSKARQEEAQDLVNHFKVFICCKKKPIPNTTLLTPKRK